MRDIGYFSRYFQYLSNSRYDSRELEIAAAKRSLYYWWWRYLRLSANYWWLCKEQGRTLDKEFAQTYGVFGDVFSLEFDEWWDLKGARAFAYSVTPPKVTLCSSDTMLIGHAEGHYIPVLIPIHLTKSRILTQLGEVLRNHRPKPLSRSITSQTDLQSMRGLSKKKIIDAHKVWCLNDAISREIRNGNLNQPQRFTQYWLGKKLRLDPRHGESVKFTINRDEKMRLALRVKVNRYLSKANNIISNVEVCKFPVVTPCETKKRWTKSQLAGMVEAIEAGEWACPESSAEEFMKLLPIK
jgi:hypothetical protein